MTSEPEPSKDPERQGCTPKQQKIALGTSLLLILVVVLGCIPLYDGDSSSNTTGALWLTRDSSMAPVLAPTPSPALIPTPVQSTGSTTASPTIDLFSPVSSLPTTTTPSPPTDSAPREFNTSFVVFDDVNGTLPLWGPTAVQGYQGDTDLFRLDVENAGLYMIRGVLAGPEAAFNRQPVAAFAEGAVDADTASTTSSASGSTVSETVDDFGNNNQEEGVEEGNVVASDGTTVWAAYQDYIVLWEARTGVDLGRVRLPAVQNAENNGGGIAESSIYRPYYSRPNIRAMVHQSNRLLVVAEGYGQETAVALDHDPILSNYKGTRLFVYDSTTMDLLGSEDVHGYFNAVRAIGNNVHVVTLSGLYTYPYLVQPFERWQYPEMTDDEFVAHVKGLVLEEGVLKDFSAKMVQELGDPLPNVARLSLLQSQFNASEPLYYSDLMQTYAQVSSFDITADLATTNQAIPLSVSGSFLPSWGSHVYAATDTLIVSMEGWDYDPVTYESTQSTYLLGLSLDGATSSPHSYGQVPGSSLNSYAIDVVGDILRIATTVNRGWGFIREPIFIDPILVDPVEDGLIDVDIADGPIVLEDEPVESRTTNYISILRLPGPTGGEPGTMSLEGQLEIGKPNESITAMRFFNDVSYAVTFERTDPLYVLDLSDPANPRALAELNITGFSSYLQSMNDDNTLLLSIGEEADEEGFSLGLAISVFDATDPANPFLAARYVVEEDPETWSGSEAQWDFMSIRYERTTQRLILPVDVSNWQDKSKEFHGFMVFVVTPNSIALDCQIEHGNPFTDAAVCYYCAYLPPRSMIFGGDVTTLDNHRVVSTDLNTCSQVWALDISIPAEADECCGYF